MATTLLDIAKLNGSDAVVGLIEENIRYSPEAEIFPFRTIRGTSYKTSIRTGLPTTGFRSANEGQTPSASTFDQRIIEAFIFSGQIEADKAVADAYESGAAAWQAIEASGVMKSSMRDIGSQIWYGTVHGAKGFPGLKQATPFGTSTLAGDALVIDAEGNTGTTQSSVYAVKFGLQDVTMIGGNNTAFDLSPFRVQTVSDSAGKRFDAYVAGLTAWLGLQVGNENSVRRIANLTVAKPLTDALLGKMLATFPVGHMPDAIFMNRRSRSQLQASRTVTLNGQGKVRPDQEAQAPLPTSYDGVPIITTDSILNTEARET